MTEELLNSHGGDGASEGGSNQGSGLLADVLAPREASSAGAAGDFWTCGEGVHALDDPTPFGQENALQKLGKPPFEKSTRSRFRLLGYLATVYEHVSQDVASRSRSGDFESPPAASSEGLD